MTSNGSRTSTATWLAVLISAVSLTFAMTYAGVKTQTESRLDRMEQDIRDIKDGMGKIDSKIDGRIVEMSKELSQRVETANKQHSLYDLRLDRIETKVGIAR